MRQILTLGDARDRATRRLGLAPHGVGVAVHADLTEPGSDGRLLGVLLVDKIGAAGPAEVSVAAVTEPLDEAQRGRVEDDLERQAGAYDRDRPGHAMLEREGPFVVDLAPAPG